MEKENKLLKSSAGEKDKMADLVEKNNALTEWRRQLVEKNQKIARLDSEVKHLKEGFIEQRQKVTMMEGDYELQIE